MMNSQGYPISKWVSWCFAVSLLLAFAGLSSAQAPATGAPGVYPYPTSPAGSSNYGGPTGSNGTYQGPGGSTPGEFSFDQPTVFQPMPQPSKTEPQSAAAKFGEAACWYLPNRLMDLTDILRFHLSIGDGMGATLRASKYLYASWFQDEAFCLGWTKRTPPWFGEHIEERYFGFFAASEGELDRDSSEIGLSAHFLVAGFNVALSAGETLDALLGFVGVDLMGDDHGPVMYDYTKPDPAQQENQLKVHGTKNAFSTSQQESKDRDKGWNQQPVPPEKPFVDPGKKITPPPQNDTK